VTERAYTVRELDELREVVEHKWVWGSYRPLPGVRQSRTYSPREKTKCVEELVRTHMIAGHTAEDLIKSEE
jgi:hypothetical protein